MEETLSISNLLPLRDLAGAQARAQCLDVHRRQSSRRRGRGLRFDVDEVQTVRGREPDPAVSHDGGLSLQRFRAGRQAVEMKINVGAVAAVKSQT